MDVDRYGNATTNIADGDLEKIGFRVGEDINLSCGGKVLRVPNDSHRPNRLS